jgi:hypothetical protein
LFLEPQLSNSISDVATEVAKGAPAYATAGLVLAGLSLNDWVLVATLVYVGLQAYVLVRDKIWPGRKKAD